MIDELGSAFQPAAAVAPTGTAIPAPAAGEVNPYAAPAAVHPPAGSGSGIEELPKVKAANFTLVAVFTLVGVIGMLASYGWLFAVIFQMTSAGNAAPEEAMTTPMILIYLSLIPWMTGWIIGLVHLYRGWVLLQPHTHYSTPGKAVGFLFIPFYNLYWYFVAYWRWAQEWNRLVANNPNHPQAPQMSEGMFLAYPITALACGILSVFGLIPMIIVYLLVQRSIARAVNYAAVR
ncbi:hypothetical protein MLD59_04875 [Verrucomicrobiaceae bacterium E54]|nr:hypothetical protein [Verrucomicrobiaceae bacterium E54]